MKPTQQGKGGYMRQYKGFMRRLARSEAGNTMAIMAAAMIPFTILVGSGVDLAVTYMARGKLQNACDAGVLAARQYMEGTAFNQAVEDEAQRFFDFNFPDGTAQSTDVEFAVVQDTDDASQLFGDASANVPTTLMRIVGIEELPISVTCDAKRDMGHNDIMLVLDVTGSMNCPPGVEGDCGNVEQDGSKIDMLRAGAAGIFRALDTDDDSVIRFGIVPYSQTVNVARTLKNRDIVKLQDYIEEHSCGGWGCSYRTRQVHINDSQWNNGNDDDVDGVGGNTEKFRTSGKGCIEERPSVGQVYRPFVIEDTVTRADVDDEAANAVDVDLQFGRYDDVVQQGEDARYNVCVAEATKLRTFDDEPAFQGAINAATSVVKGYTYHDVGMLWGLRFISRTGFFEADNPTERLDIPVNQHIVFMTDGIMNPNSSVYSAHGIETRQNRTQGSGTLKDQHLARFLAACELAKSMEITVWVIVLAEDETDDIEPCATSSAHFKTSEGEDLEQVFEEIGRGIGNLRLTR